MLKKYSEIGCQLKEQAITDYYVMMEGFLYHHDPNGIMMPIELGHYPYHKKIVGERNILYVQDAACIRTHKIASIMKEAGYMVYLLYTIAPPDDANRNFSNLYDGLIGFTSVEGIIDYIENSEFDLIHCSNAPDILTNVARLTTKPIVFDTHDMNTLWGKETAEDYIMEYIANTYSDGNFYYSNGVADIARRKYGLDEKKLFILENCVLNQVLITKPYPKLSLLDQEIHCVYEGGINGKDKESDRYFEKIWEQITKFGIHIHYYSQSDSEYCKKLAKGNKYLHFEGNIGSNELVQEMTKYDCGLAIFQVTEQNRMFLETGTANKIYEYLNAQLPVVVGDVDSYVDFVRKYDVGIQLDFTKDIRNQIVEVCQKEIDPNFLRNNLLTMKARGKQLVAFYERILSKTESRHD